MPLVRFVTVRCSHADVFPYERPVLAGSTHSRHKPDLVFHLVHVVSVAEGSVGKRQFSIQPSCDAPAMTKFTVVASDHQPIDYEGSYKIGDGGVLAIKPQRGNLIVYSPAGWLHVEVTEAPVSVYEQSGLSAS